MSCQIVGAFAACLALSGDERRIGVSARGHTDDVIHAVAGDIIVVGAPFAAADGKAHRGARVIVADIEIHFIGARGTGRRRGGSLRAQINRRESACAGRGLGNECRILLGRRELDGGRIVALGAVGGKGRRGADGGNENCRRENDCAQNQKWTFRLTRIPPYSWFRPIILYPFSLTPAVSRGEGEDDARVSGGAVKV